MSQGYERMKNYFVELRNGRWMVVENDGGHYRTVLAYRSKAAADKAAEIFKEQQSHDNHQKLG
jgi:hypothetical protein